MRFLVATGDEELRDKTVINNNDIRSFNYCLLQNDHHHRHNRCHRTDYVWKITSEIKVHTSKRYVTEFFIQKKQGFFCTFSFLSRSIDETLTGAIIS